MNERRFRSARARIGSEDDVCQALRRQSSRAEKGRDGIFSDAVLILFSIYQKERI